MAIIKEEHKSRFTPYFTTAIGNQVLKLTIGEMERHPEKYANTHLSEMYEDVSRYEKAAKTRSVKINMSNVQRGVIFDKDHKTAKQKKIEAIKVLSKKMRAKLGRNLEQKTILLESKAKEEAAKAKKEAAKAKKEAAKETPNSDADALKNAAKEK